MSHRVRVCKPCLAAGESVELLRVPAEDVKHGDVVVVRQYRCPTCNYGVQAVEAGPRGPVLLVPSRSEQNAG